MIHTCGKEQAEQKRLESRCRLKEELPGQRLTTRRNAAGMKIFVKRTGTENFSNPTSSNLETHHRWTLKYGSSWTRGPPALCGLPVCAEAAVVAPGVRG